MTKFKLKIITPHGIYQEVEIDQINIRTTAGQIGILAHHIPLASGVEISQMNYIVDGKKTYFAVAGGFVHVNENETTLIANAIESQEEIDLHRAEEAKQRAEERLQNKNSDTDILRAEIALRRALTRIHVKGL
ncbi:F0F1 ATP synthase subunit epsilon [[Clostridium] spiroforme]|nr:F0F1 ATP synthase subunit epsilon [Thomasclavelia spiroformis]MBM6879714.1 F0F1 ATP synthase subunit epsilon [Thomasclavelia spiroformis]MBM6929979.1 F0F1 ATP synthase subunit epsilon [Thomasclavelia spiroformis]